MNVERLIFWLSKAKISKTLFQNINQDLFKNALCTSFFLETLNI